MRTVIVSGRNSTRREGDEEEFEGYKLADERIEQCVLCGEWECDCEDNRYRRL